MRNLNVKHFAKPRRQEGERIVQNDLAYTPSQMMELTSKGIAVSEQNLNVGSFYDGDTNPGFDVPFERLRGIDVADCWQVETSLKKKAKKGLKDDIASYGAWKPEVKGE